MSQEYFITPEDAKGYKAIGVKLPFNKNAFAKTAQQAYDSPPARDVGIFESSYSTEEQVISNYINLLLTRRGERVMHPDFGTLVRDFVFEQNTEVNKIILENDIREATEYWLPYVNLIRLELGAANITEFPSNETEHSLLINIVFRVLSSGANKTIKIFVTETGQIQTEVI